MEILCWNLGIVFVNRLLPSSHFFNFYDPKSYSVLLLDLDVLGP